MISGLGADTREADEPPVRVPLPAALPDSRTDTRSSEAETPLLPADEPSDGPPWRGRFEPRGMRRMAALLLRSLVARLVLLVVVFAAVPIVLYEQFREADAARQAILLGAIRDKGILIGRAMAPLLSRAESVPYVQLGAELAGFTEGTVNVRLLYRPNAADPLGFFYVASSPPIAIENLTIERQQLIEAGILKRLAESCEGDLTLAHRIERPDGHTELLTSIVPVRTLVGCWAVVSSNTLSELGDQTLGLPYWQFPEVRIAGAIYLALAVIVLFVFFDLWRNLLRFGRIARTIGAEKMARFSARDIIPELHVVAREFDRMVDTLQESAASIRRAAEDNAHAFKTPIGIIRQSLEPLRRRLPADEPRVERSLAAINAALDKLDGLLTTARRLERATADALDPPRERISLTDVVRSVVADFAHALPATAPRIVTDIADGLRVIGSTEMMETAVENVLENAVSFTPASGFIRIRAHRDGRGARIMIEDEGPGVPADRLHRIFDRYYSVRPAGAASAAGNFGIGLWIVRRNVEAMGGRIWAENRRQGGLRVTIEFPAV